MKQYKNDERWQEQRLRGLGRDYTPEVFIYEFRYEKLIWDLW